MTKRDQSSSLSHDQEKEESNGSCDRGRLSHDQEKEESDGSCERGGCHMTNRRKKVIGHMTGFMSHNSLVPRPLPPGKGSGDF